LRDRHPSVEAIGAGAAGMVGWPGGHVRWAPNNAYRDLPLRHLLAEQTGLPAVVDGAATLALDQTGPHRSAPSEPSRSQDAASAARQHPLPPVRQGTSSGTMHQSGPEIPGQPTWPAS
jgi:hypothetical protein